MASAFKQWTCLFPGKMGLAWKRACSTSATREEAEALAAQSCNVVAVPLKLAEHIEELYARLNDAENKAAKLLNENNSIRAKLYEILE